MACLWSVVTLVFLSVLAGCVGAGRVVPVSSLTQLEPEATVELGSSAAGVCRDGEELLVLENSGTRVVRYGTATTTSGTVPVRGQSPFALVVLDTLPLTERVTAPAGVSADRFYVYVYDDHALYRMSKEKLSLQPWAINVRVVGLAVFESGTVLFSEESRGSIWYKGLFGESRRFMSDAEVARPGAMAALGGGDFAVLSGTERLVYFNRSGVVQRTLAIPAGCDLLTGGDKGALFIGQRGEPQVWMLEENRMTGFRLPDSVSPLSIAAVRDRLVVLDAGARVSLYRVPEAE
jgi:hypothetical protein